jgi:hypothetical protein
LRRGRLASGFPRLPSEYQSVLEEVQERGAAWFEERLDL